MDATQVAQDGGSVGEILDAMDPEYKKEWPQAAHDWAVQLHNDGERTVPGPTAE